MGMGSESIPKGIAVAVADGQCASFTAVADQCRIGILRHIRGNGSGEDDHRILRTVLIQQFTEKDVHLFKDFRRFLRRADAGILTGKEILIQHGFLTAHRGIVDLALLAAEGIIRGNDGNVHPGIGGGRDRSDIHTLAIQHTLDLRPGKSAEDADRVTVTAEGTQGTGYVDSLSSGGKCRANGTVQSLRHQRTGQSNVHIQRGIQRNGNVFHSCVPFLFRERTYTSRYSAYFAFFAINSRRGSTLSPISSENISSQDDASSIVTSFNVRVVGSMVVSHN